MDTTSEAIETPAQKRHRMGSHPGNIDYMDRFKKKNPHRADHLKPFQFKKGEVHNPNGFRDRNLSLVEELKKWLRRHPEDGQAIVAALIKQGKIGNIIATKEMLDRIDGKVEQAHRIEGELPVQIMFVPAQQLLREQAEQSVITEGETRELTEGE